MFRILYNNLFLLLELLYQEPGDLQHLQLSHMINSSDFSNLLPANFQ